MSRKSKSKDHAPPKKWLPKGSPGHTAPSCSTCNGRYGEFENQLLIALGIAMSPRDPRVRYFRELALRAIDPSAGKNDRDRAARADWRDHVGRMFAMTAGRPAVRQLPGFEQGPSQGPGFLITVAALDEFVEKCIRVLTWSVYRERIEPPQVVHVRSEIEPERFTVAVQHATRRIEHAPGITTSVVEGQTERIWAFDYFGRLRMLGAVTLHPLPRPRPRLPNFKRPRLPGEG